MQYGIKIFIIICPRKRNEYFGDLLDYMGTIPKGDSPFDRSCDGTPTECNKKERKFAF